MAVLADGIASGGRETVGASLGFLKRRVFSCRLASLSSFQEITFIREGRHQKARGSTKAGLRQRRRRSVASSLHSRHFLYVG
jgi:hypothetical protein